MIWYKSSIQERSSPLGAKMGRGSPVCQQIREKIIEMFKSNVPQRKIGRDLDISPSTVHNIIKRFKESGGISVRKGQGCKPKLNNRDIRSLRRHCIKNRHSSISDITTWAVVEIESERLISSMKSMKLEKQSSRCQNKTLLDRVTKPR